MNTLHDLLTQPEDLDAEVSFGCQIQKCSPRTTKSQKPYYDLTVVDAREQTSLKIWNNHPQFDQAVQLQPGQFLRITGQFTSNQYGLESPSWKWEPLSDEDLDTLLAGDPSLKVKQEEDLTYITQSIENISDPRLKALGLRFLKDFSGKFQRAAAARKNHHARRGGLIEHVAQMMKTASALCTAYPYLNKDLLLTAILFHDSGKLWENNYPENDFHQIHSMPAEALGHICLGIELVNKLWRDVSASTEADHWKTLSPATEKVRIHLLHLIASHHGTLEFGSPVPPKTPEAFTLHYIDNLDAKLEMCAEAYQTAPLLSAEVYEKKFPLPAPLITPLPSVE